MSTDTTKETTDMDSSNMFRKIREQGLVFALLLAAVVWLNNRLATVEQRLYECYSGKTEYIERSSQERNYPADPIRYEAVLPSSDKHGRQYGNDSLIQ